MTEEQLYLLQQASDRLNAAKILLNSGYTKDAATRATTQFFMLLSRFCKVKGNHLVVILQLSPFLAATLPMRVLCQFIFIECC